MSLRSKLLLSHALVALVGVVLISTAINRFAPNRLQELVRQRTVIEAELRAAQIADRYEQAGGWPQLQAELRRLVRRGALQAPPGERLVLADNNDRVLLDTGGALEGRQLPKRLQIVTAAVIVDGKQVGSVSLLPLGLLNRLNRMEDQYTQVIRQVLIRSSFSAAIVALIVGGVLALGLTRPLRLLTRASHELATGATPRVVVATRDELGELAAAFNAMAAELSRQRELRQQLVADIAHELRTPLSVLRLQLEAVEDGVEAPTPELWSSLKEEVALLTHLVEDLRLLSLVEAGQLPLDLQQVDLRQVVQRAIAIVAPKARAAAIHLSVELPPTAVCVSADEDRLVQVCVNLLDNAVRHTTAGGQILVSIAHPESIPGAQMPPGAWAGITVRDSGSGIAPEELPYIWERFRRADRHRTRDTGGSGLGLSIVQGLVEAMGGRVWATSEIGAGSTFGLALPVSLLDA
jgi:signal transduction histidine kinase